MARVGNRNDAAAVVVAAACGTRTTTTRTAVQKWRCDVCKERFFEDFDEACAHERDCQNTSNINKTPIKATLATPLVTQDTMDLHHNPIFPKEEEEEKQQQHVYSNNLTDAMESKAKKKSKSKTKKKMNPNNNKTDSTTKPPSPIITPTKPSPKSSRSDSMISGSSSSSSNGINSNGNGNISNSNKTSLLQSRIDGSRPTVRDVYCDFYGCDGADVNTVVMDIKKQMFQLIKPMKESPGLTEEEIEELRDMFRLLESVGMTLGVLQTTLIGTVVSKFKKHPVLGPTAKMLVRNWKAIASTKTTTNNDATSNPKNSKENKSKHEIAKRPPTQQKSHKQTRAPTTQKQQHAFFNPRCASSTSSSSSKSSSSSSSSSSSVPINPFFAPRKRAPSATDAVLEQTRSLKRKLPPQQSIIGVDANTDGLGFSPETTKVVVASVSNTKKPPTAETRSLKRKLPSKPRPTTTVDAGNDIDTTVVDAYNNNNNAGQLSVETTRVVASIFQNKPTKQIIAEQRRAELAAHRETERKRDAERAAKRLALFGGQQQRQQRNNATKQPSRSQEQRLPVAPRFPVPNHVAVGESMYNSCNEATTTTTTSTTITLPENHPFRSRFESASNSRTTPTTPTSWLSFPSALDTVDVTTTNFTAIQRALFETFSILPDNSRDHPRSRTIPPATATTNWNTMLWNDVFGRMDKDDIVGTQPLEVFRQLAECIDHWRVARTESLERMAERHRKLAKNGKKKPKRPNKRKKNNHHKNPPKRSRGGYSCDNDDDDDWLVGSDDEDDDAMAPLCLLVGPHASGKTAMVRSVAKHCGNCTVLEINTSKARSGASLKHAIEEATQSNSTLEMLQNKSSSSSSNKNNNAFFGARKNDKTKKQRAADDLVDSDDDDDESNNTKKKSPVTIVLIDEVDILFEENGGDAGFWTALWALARATKCPIVLTANECPPQLEKQSSSTSVPCKILRLEKPAPSDCASKLWGILRRNNKEQLLQISPGLASKGPCAVRKQLETIAESCGCDLRKLLHELQVFAALAKATKAGNIGATALTKRTKATTEIVVPSSPILALAATPPVRSTCNNSMFRSNHTIHIPSVLSVEPCRIPMDGYSVVVAKGTNFETLKAATSTSTVRIQLGPFTIPEWTVVDDTTMILLCQPYEEKQDDNTDGCSSSSSSSACLIFSLSIELQQGAAALPLRISSPTRTLVSEELANGTILNGTHRPTIEYIVVGPDQQQQQQQQDAESVAECENELDVEQQRNNNRASPPEEDDESAAAAVATIPDNYTTDKARAGWRNYQAAVALRKTKGPLLSPPLQKVAAADVAASDDGDMDVLARMARDASDACLLEDGGDGLPYLSGACRGFAYDHTEERCPYQGGADTLKMHEKSKPPREEKLFALGWKDNCCFYGNSETYMTPPSLSQRKEAKHAMNYFRGNEWASGQLACASATASSSSATAASLSQCDLEADSVVFREDLDTFVHHNEASGVVGEEDSYLPKGVPQSVLDLPTMLRTRSVANRGDNSGEEMHHRVWEALEAHRSETLAKLVEHTTEYILPPLSSSSSSSWHNKNDRSRWLSYGRFGLDTNKNYQADRTNLILECLPVLRRIGIVERNAEFVQEQQQQQIAAAAATTGADRQSSSLRRSTRRVTRAAPKPRFQHYFDKLSATLRRDEADLETSAVGALFAGQWQSDLVRPFHKQPKDGME